MRIYPVIASAAEDTAVRVVLFAAKELGAYLARITGERAQILPQQAYDASQPDGLWLGVGGDLPLQAPPVESALDDSVAVRVRGTTGLIAGASPRSLLLAVYRFLHELGCRWPRPAPDPGLVPRRNLEYVEVDLSEKAAYRHRALCIEGAVSLEHVLAVIDWAPKVGLSGYFTQFREGHTFFDRWYGRRYNPLKPPESCTVDQARAYTRSIEDELARRGMVYHAVGHGWTCEAYGIAGLGWDPVVQDWPAEVLDALALVNGKRAMWHDIPLITSLCFSQPEVRRRVVECVVDYLVDHRNIDALHFWLDDGFNNKCECDQCAAMRPADFYVRLLNELDAALTARGYQEKVVFLSYADLLFPPEIERLVNPERFILMFAPITRSYRRPLYPQDPNFTPPPYVRNQVVFSNNNDEQLAYLRGWQEVFQGDSFIFEYHLIQAGAYFNDPDSGFMARLLFEDIRNLRTLGLNGYVSCQFLRQFFPTGLSMYVLGRALWDESVTFEALADDYYTAAFGPDAAACRAYLEGLASLQDVVPLNEKVARPEALPVVQAARQHLNAIVPVLERNLDLPEATQARSWQILAAHSQLLRVYLDLLEARAVGDFDLAGSHWQAMKDLAWTLEEDLQSELDVYGLVHHYNARLS